MAAVGLLFLSGRTRSGTATQGDSIRTIAPAAAQRHTIILHLPSPRKFPIGLSLEDGRRPDELIVRSTRPLSSPSLALRQESARSGGGVFRVSQRGDRGEARDAGLHHLRGVLRRNAADGEDGDFRGGDQLLQRVQARSVTPALPSTACGTPVRAARSPRGPLRRNESAARRDRRCRSGISPRRACGRPPGSSDRQPRCTPSAPAASATSSRWLTISAAPASRVIARSFSASS